MLRRSFRLQDRGYYTEEGTPSVCYREVVHRIFRKRTSCGRVHHNVNSIEHYTSGRTTGTLPTLTSATGTQAIRRNMVRTTSSFYACGFLGLLLLAFGIIHYTHMHMEMRDVQQKVQSLRRQMNMFLPLANTMPNFALESQGARVLHQLSSDTYWPQEDIGIVWDRIFCWWYSSKVQRQVIQGHSLLRPGECWPFSGDRGHLFISLSHPVSITHVTLSHITKSQSPYGHIASAPREFSIYGMRTTDEEGTYLGTLVYDQDGAADQTFELPNPDKGVFRYVKLQIENNWGNIDNTCLYSFKVHGKLPSNSTVT
ncbi:SUN domain-containing protein 1-like isoform X2 [Micropterus dolomieu]|uniref:SUN domain-containing protein 1-like isoform X2 n=1 Tax=Micropterus dolomieu TaxID=147949 RepID=UPI001E8DDDDA|nr:SUN domain-containing protein 1-like isoform X2 [Micropterus dolomieu]